MAYRYRPSRNSAKEGRGSRGQSYPRGRFLLRPMIPYCYRRPIPRRRPVQAAVG